MAVGVALNDELFALFNGDPRLCSNPYPLYHRLRGASPVHFFSPELAAVASHAEAKEAARDNRRFSSWKAQSGFADEFALLNDEELDLFEKSARYGRLGMSGKDGEEHRRVRDAVHVHFTPRRIGDLGTVAQHTLDELLAPLAGSETCDLVSLAFRLPLYVILAMLGMPRDDEEAIRTWGKQVLYHKGRAQLEPEGVRAMHQAWLDFGAYVGRMVDERRRDPGRTDLVAALVEAEEGDRLSNEELVVALTQIITGGHETTSNMIGNGIAAMLHDREQWELLCSDPEGHAAGAVEESLRFDAPIQSNQRLCAVDTELGGVEIPAGTKLLLFNASANRDPEAFRDPDRLDITRRPNDHLSFSYGPHFCLGAPLARLEGAVVYSTLARRFPDMELAVPYEELEWTGPALHGLKRLPVGLRGSRKDRRGRR
jgi:cytochrome P450